MQIPALLNLGMDRNADFLEDPFCHARTIDFYIKCFYPDDQARLFSDYEKKERERMALMGETPHEWAVRMGVPDALLCKWELMLHYCDMPKLQLIWKMLTTAAAASVEDADN